MIAKHLLEDRSDRELIDELGATVVATGLGVALVDTLTETTDKTVDALSSELEETADLASATLDLS